MSSLENQRGMTHTPAFWGYVPSLGRRQTSLNNKTGNMTLSLLKVRAAFKSSFSSPVDGSALPWLVREWQL